MKLKLHQFMGDYLSRGLLASLSAVFIAVLAATTFLTYTMLDLNRLVQDSSEDVRAATTLQDLLLNLRQAESGQRGYIITGDKAYLVPYQQAIARMPADVKNLQNDPELMADYSSDINQLQQLTTQRIVALDKAIDAYNTGGYQAAAEVIKTTGSAQLTGRIRTLTSRIGDTTFKSIGPEQAKSRQSLRRSLVTTVVLVVFILLMCGIIIRYFHRAIVKERAIEGAKNEFLSLASHQLRTPATSVKQYLGMLQGGFFGDLNEEQREAISVAYVSNETGISIINSLLNAAKLSLGKIQLARKLVPVAPLVQEVVDEHRAQVAEKNQRISFKNDFGKRRSRLDAVYFKTVIENLVDNAVKYSPEGADITLRLRPRKDGKWFVLTVSDTGIGISKQDISKLFLKFSRLQNEYSETSEGSGLGLYWAKQVVELHGGKIEAAPNPGGGSKFRITMPLQK